MKRRLLLVIGLALLVGVGFLSYRWSSEGTSSAASDGAVVLDVSGGASTAASDLSADDPRVSYPAGWTIVGGPPGTTFSQARSPLWTMQPSPCNDWIQHPSSQAITPGWGYWARFSSSTTVQIPGGGWWWYSVRVPAGCWVMVGNPCGNGRARIIGATRIWQYDESRGWFRSPILDVGRGAFVRRDDGGWVHVWAQACRPDRGCEVPPTPPPGCQLVPEVDPLSLDEAEDAFPADATHVLVPGPRCPTPIPCCPTPTPVCPTPTVPPICSRACEQLSVAIDLGEGSTYCIGDDISIHLRIPCDGYAEVWSWVEGGTPYLVWDGYVSEGDKWLGPYTEWGPAGKTWLEVRFWPEGADEACVDRTWYWSEDCCPWGGYCPPGEM